jgi:hypothetical protein
MIQKILFSVALFFSMRATSQNTSYYIDNLNGNDNNDGRSINTAWRSLAKLNALIFKPGDHINLKRGQAFRGFLNLHGSGEKGNAIKLTSFGTGKRPVIDGGSTVAVIQVLDEKYWEIENIETTGGNYAGIFIGCTKDSLVLGHFRITDCYVHDIGDTSKLSWDYSKSTGGIIVTSGTFDSTSHPVFYNSVFNDVVINNCTVRYNYRWTCLSISSGKINGQRGNANHIKNCITEYSSADGIRMNGVRNSFIEYCVMYKNGAWPKPSGRNLGGLGAWFFDAENCTIQFCEAGFVRGASTDAGAFDIDYWQKNSTVQYCYGHDCAGYGISIFGADPAFATENSTARYNVFVNNGQDSAFTYEGDFFIYTWNGGLLNGVNVHDNISFWNPVTGNAALKFEADFTGNNPNVFSNNSIHSKYFLLDSLKNDSLKCDGNTYWVVNGKPAWKMRNDKYYSLQDWQKATGQDLHSTYANVEKMIPSWHKFPVPSKPFRKKQKGQQPTTSSSSRQELNVPDRGSNLTLISFINTSDSFGLERTFSQMAFIKSMRTQYAEKGLKIVLVDESGFIAPNRDSKMSLTNFINDNGLEDIVMIQDDKSATIAAKYSVTIAPSTLLISADGIVRQKWAGLVLPAQLAFAIESVLKKIN